VVLGKIATRIATQRGSTERDKALHVGACDRKTRDKTIGAMTRRNWSARQAKGFKTGALNHLATLPRLYNQTLTRPKIEHPVNLATHLPPKGNEVSAWSRLAVPY
jgi:hypothetical protein